MQVETKHSSLPETEHFPKPFSWNYSVKEMVLSKGKLGQCFSRIYKYAPEFNSWAFLKTGKAHLALFTFASAYSYLCRDVEYFSKSIMVHSIFFFVWEWKKSSFAAEYHIKHIRAVPIQHPIPKLQCLLFSRNSLGKKFNVFVHRISAENSFEIVFSIKKLSAFPLKSGTDSKWQFFSSVLL